MAQAGCHIDSKSKGLKTTNGKHPDHSTSIKRVNRIKGQIEAVSRMIDERR